MFMFILKLSGYADGKRPHFQRRESFISYINQQYIPFPHICLCSKDSTAVDNDDDDKNQGK